MLLEILVNKRVNDFKHPLLFFKWFNTNYKDSFDWDNVHQILESKPKANNFKVNFTEKDLSQYIEQFEDVFADSVIDKDLDMHEFFIDLICEIVISKEYSKKEEIHISGFGF